MDIKITGEFLMTQEQYDLILSNCDTKEKLQALHNLNIKIKNSKNDQNICN